MMPPVAPIANKTLPGRGCLILVLGASGAGKDTLLSIAAETLGDRKDIHFLQRVITREAHDQSENFRPVSDAEFDRAVAEGEFCFFWQANGLRYGLPRDMVLRLERGEVVVVNGSRAACEDLRKAFGRVQVVEIHVDPAVLAERLHRRGRETTDEIAARVVRAERLTAMIKPDLTINNSGPAEVAGAMLAGFIVGQAESLKTQMP